MKSARLQAGIDAICTFRRPVISLHLLWLETASPQSDSIRFDNVGTVHQQQFVISFQNDNSINMCLGIRNAAERHRQSHLR